MSFEDIFDENSPYTSELNIKPYAEVHAKDKAKKLDWLNNVFNSLLEQGKQRTRIQRENLAHYRGITTTRVDRTRDFNGKRLNKVQKFVVNHLFDLTETKVSQMNKLKPAVEVIPNNDEWGDRASAKVVQFLIKHLWYINNIDYMMQDMHRYARIFGESFIFVTWDKDAGDLHPAYIKAKDLGLKEIVLPSGKKHSLKKPIKTGDIKYEVEVPWRVFLQRKNKYSQVEYMFRLCVEKVDDLKKKYPSKAKDIKDSNKMSLFDMEDLTERFIEEHVVTIEFWHKNMGEVDKGSYVKFTENTILEEGDNPFSHGGLPVVRLTDLDIPEVLNGVSKYETIIPMQNMYNNLSTLIAKNIYLTAHAKWMMPRGACKIDQLGNDNTIVQYQGPVPPQLVQTQPNAPEVYTFRQQVKEEMQTVYGSHGISRGEVPKGITAASALQFLNELENERSSTDVAKHGFMVKDLAKMTIAVTGDKYEVDDGRMVRIVGESNKYLIRHFDVSNLNKSYDIRFDLSTGLPETKSAKYQRILDAMQRNPEMLAPERWTELLELANTEKMNTLITEAVKAADSENEDLLEGREVAPPTEWEDGLAHWDSHSKTMQSRTFKEEAEPEIREYFIEHVRMTEMVLLDKASRNPLLSSKLAALPMFPLFDHAGAVTPVSAQHQEALVQGQSNRGEDVTGQIPGVEQPIINNSGGK